MHSVLHFPHHHSAKNKKCFTCEANWVVEIKQGKTEEHISVGLTAPIWHLWDCTSHWTQFQDACNSSTMKEECIMVCANGSKWSGVLVKPMRSFEPPPPRQAPTGPECKWWKLTTHKLNCQSTSQRQRPGEDWHHPKLSSTPQTQNRCCGHQHLRKLGHASGRLVVSDNNAIDLGSTEASDKKTSGCNDDQWPKDQSNK